MNTAHTVIDAMSRHERWSYFRTLGFYGSTAALMTAEDREAYALGIAARMVK